MASSAVKACVLAPFLLLAGCSAFFGFNLLKGLDKPPAPKASDYEGPGGLDKLQTDLNSPAVVAALKGDPTTTQQIENYLATTYLTGPLTTSDQQKAAVLYADLSLKTTSGDQFVNNAANLVLSGNGSGQTIQQILQGIVPADVASDPAAFTAMVGGLLNAASAYQLLGASLAPPATAPPGMNMGDVAQKAAVAYTMQSMVYEIINASGGGTADAIQQMYNLLNNQPNTVPASTIDPFTTPIAPYDSTSLQNVKNIFKVAGATMPS